MSLPYWPPDLDARKIAADVERSVDGEIQSKRVTLRVFAADDGLLTIRGARRGADITLKASELLHTIARGLERG